MSENKATHGLAADRPSYFRSLRWTLTLPLLFMLIPAVMLATYLITDALVRNARERPTQSMLSGIQSASDRLATLAEAQRREAERVAFTQGIPDQIASRNVAALQALTRPLAATADLDYLIISTARRQEVLGLQRSGNTYQISQNGLLDQLASLDGVLDGSRATASELVHTANGYMLFTAAPVHRGKDPEVMGVAVVGLALNRVLNTLRSDDQTWLVVFGPSGELLESTISPAQSTLLDALRKASGTFGQAGSVEPAIVSLGPLSALSADQHYLTASTGFVVNGTRLGTVALVQADTVGIAAEGNRQTLSIGLSVAVGGILLVVFVLTTLATRRLERITKTAQTLASGDLLARTGMQPVDEVGELGRAVDVYAQRVQKRHDALEALLRQERSESARLVAVLEALPDGVIVQDLNGRVVLMNDRALNLLGSQRVFRSSPLNELTAIVTDTLGPALALGIFSLGEPHQIPLDGKVLQAQAAAIVNTISTRIGTVIVLKDITEDVQREQARTALLSQMAHNAQIPSNHPKFDRIVSGNHSDDTLQLFIKELKRNAIALQRTISELQELSTLDAEALRENQQALDAEYLIWQVASEWQAAATDAHIQFHVMILRRGLLVLGEEKRLRWAMGSLVDNALKYTQSRGHVTLQLCASEDEKYAQFSVIDTGVGITSNDLPHVFTRFFRGKPIARNGQLIQTPGTGQGLFSAQRIIEAHGGRISLKSTLGRGTEVIFTLPLTANLQLDLAELGGPREATPDQEMLSVKTDSRADAQHSQSS